MKINPAGTFSFKKTFIVVLLLASSAVWFGCGGDEKADAPLTHLRLAEIHDQSGNIELARYHLNLAVKDEDEAMEAREYLDHLESRIDKARQYIRGLQDKASMGLSERSLAKNLYQQGICFELMGMNEEAIRVFSHSLKLDENNALASLHLALIQEKEGDIRGAEESIQRAMDSSITTASIRFQAALFFIRNGNLPRAAELARPLEEIKPVYFKIISGEPGMKDRL